MLRQAPIGQAGYMHADRFDITNKKLAKGVGSIHAQKGRLPHATHALAKGVELSAVRDNLRHASISTTSIYLHSDDVKRARQFGQAFTA